MVNWLNSRAGVTLLLFFGLVYFSTATIICAAAMPSNEKIYVFLTGIAGGFSGALFTYVQSFRTDKEKKNEVDQDDPQ